jgi:hypothetical protein
MDLLTWGVVGFVAVLVLLALGIRVGLALAVLILVPPISTLLPAAMFGK